MAENKVSNSKIGKKISQISDVSSTKNIVDKSEAEELSQEITSQPQGLQLSKHGGKASGRFAIICLLIIVVAYIWFNSSSS